MLGNISSLRLVFLLSSDDPGPWDPRDPVAVEPSLCPSFFQDLAEPDPLETDVAFVSNVVIRANHLFNISDFRIIRGHCLGKPLDAIVDAGRVLQEER